MLISRLLRKLRKRLDTETANRTTTLWGMETEVVSRGILEVHGC
jgi:hypothetical protein